MTHCKSIVGQSCPFKMGVLCTCPEAKPTRCYMPFIISEFEL